MSWSCHNDSLSAGWIPSSMHVSSPSHCACACHQRVMNGSLCAAFESVLIVRGVARCERNFASFGCSWWYHNRSNKDNSSRSPIVRQMGKRWLPLESNPDVLNDFTNALGLDVSKSSFQDVFGLDEV